MAVVVVVDEAEDQLREIVDWWSMNRPAASRLPLDEFERCIALLAARPAIGAPWLRSDLPGVRRLLMHGTRWFLYYLHDAAHDVVYVLAVWGAPRGSAPMLRDPRR